MRIKSSVPIPVKNSVVAGESGQQRHQESRAEHGDDVLRANPDGARPRQALLGLHHFTRPDGLAIAVQFPSERSGFVGVSGVSGVSGFALGEVRAGVLGLVGVGGCGVLSHALLLSRGDVLAQIYYAGWSESNMGTLRCGHGVSRGWGMGCLRRRRFGFGASGVWRGGECGSAGGRCGWTGRILVSNEL